jgi:hypothetical protein
VSRYILTCAQNNTLIHEAVWENLTALSRHYAAEILVSRFSYDKASHNKGAKPGTEADRDDLWYDPKLTGFFSDERIQLAPGLVWCGEMNILPTAVRPLSGLEAYTGRQSGIFPHVKLAMDSIASGKREPTKFNYTTGTITQRNYIQKKAGQKAEFHHCYGGLLVEVDSDGAWWVRQLNADSDGVIYDWDLKADRGKVTAGHRVKAINWGDIHVGRIEPKVAAASWGPGGMLDSLQPEFQFAHDTLDFHSDNHHDRLNPHRRYELYITGQTAVEQEIQSVARFLFDIQRKNCETVVVDSNHDNALERWLREADHKKDPANAIFYLEAQLAKYRAIRRGDKNFHLLEWAVKRAFRDKQAVNADLQNLKFLREDESFVICRDRNGGIECGMHGHLGPNGARGSIAAFAKMGRKANLGHSHTAGIRDGIYQDGTSSELDLGYNRGPSSWSWTHTITYQNGKRTLVTVWRGKCRA